MSDKDYKVSEETRAGRRVETQEVFTPESVVEYMLDRLDPEDFVPLDKNWLDNSCGNGNLLVGIINRRLAAQPGGRISTEIMDAVMSTTYGTELMEDNVAECRQRLYALFVTRYGYNSPKDHNKNLKRIIERNIVCTDMFEWDYDNWRPKVKPKQLSLL